MKEWDLRFTLITKFLKLDHVTELRSLRFMKKLMKKFQSLDDDDAGDEKDSPIQRRKSGKLKRRRSKGGEEL